nr:unnamed protein product [Callosobruchus chinensis]
MVNSRPSEEKSKRFLFTVRCVTFTKPKECFMIVFRIVPSVKNMQGNFYPNLQLPAVCRTKRPHLSIHCGKTAIVQMIIIEELYLNLVETTVDALITGIVEANPN